jgi:hypothetical protein
MSSIHLPSNFVGPSPLVVPLSQPLKTKLNASTQASTTKRLSFFFYRNSFAVLMRRRHIFKISYDALIGSSNNKIIFKL